MIMIFDSDRYTHEEYFHRFDDLPCRPSAQTFDQRFGRTRRTTQVGADRRRLDRHVFGHRPRAQRRTALRERFLKKPCERHIGSVSADRDTICYMSCICDAYLWTTATAYDSSHWRPQPTSRISWRLPGCLRSIWCFSWSISELAFDLSIRCCQKPRSLRYWKNLNRSFARLIFMRVNDTLGRLSKYIPLVGVMSHLHIFFRFRAISRRCAIFKRIRIFCALYYNLWNFLILEDFFS